jgi:hypothetical protein
MACEELVDESKFYLSQFEWMLKCGFSKCELQMFNLLSYPLKALGDRLGFISKAIQHADAFLFRTFPGLLRYGANCNVIFTK